KSPKLNPSSPPTNPKSLPLSISNSASYISNSSLFFSFLSSFLSSFTHSLTKIFLVGEGVRRIDCETKTKKRLNISFSGFVSLFSKVVVYLKSL
ncbi:unnamed protein product, partial [Arabidopsis halleri]